MVITINNTCYKLYFNPILPSYKVLLIPSNLDMNQDELRKNLSFNIKQRRKLFTMTQEKLAEDTGLSAQTINDIEGCRTWVSDKTLVKLAEVLRTTPAELLLQNTNEQSETLDFLKFKSELQDSVRQTIEDMFEKRKI